MGDSAKVAELEDIIMERNHTIFHLRRQINEMDLWTRVSTDERVKQLQERIELLEAENFELKLQLRYGKKNDN